MLLVRLSLVAFVSVVGLIGCASGGDAPIDQPTGTGGVAGSTGGGGGSVASGTGGTGGSAPIGTGGSGCTIPAGLHPITYVVGANSAPVVKNWTVLMEQKVVCMGSIELPAPDQVPSGPYVIWATSAVSATMSWGPTAGVGYGSYVCTKDLNGRMGSPEVCNVNITVSFSGPAQ